MRISDWSSDVCSSDLLPFPVHQTSAPPPKEKKERKKLEAANAIDRPNTIWTSRRKPPEVSPKARLRPVTMMMITATAFATGPSMLSRIDCRGASHGIDEPPAWAGADTISATSIAVEQSMAQRAPCLGARLTIGRAHV